ncbi:Calx-beta domain protein [Rubripirellula amarantea]|uniref:Calx-beta domain protein n=1 Tax=Rubripirellula amarantea TaxID=2527999 RepID=A0A5C5WFP3_9BACT|nr:Calx-beta domain-containing protein [Rubripirellula amarantea]TWT49574.1 Calx-beta domain protein [Rubripirellula amarantea]
MFARQPVSMGKPHRNSTAVGTRNRLRSKFRSLLGERLEDRRVLASYVVDTAEDVVADDGMISLREALQASNTNAVVNADTIAGEAGPDIVDTITFASGLSQITLSSQLTISDAVAISLGDATDVTISGNFASRIFSIDIGTIFTIPNEVSIDGLTLIEGVADIGGAILVNRLQELTLNDVTIQTSEATGNESTEGGGALFNDGGIVTITNSTFEDNVASGTSGSGGAIFNAEIGTLSVTDSIIRNNVANRAGGRIEDNSGSGFGTTLDGVTLSGNMAGPAGFAAPGNGGGLHVTGTADVEVIGSTIDANFAASEGGGLWNDSGTMTISTDSVITNNIAAGMGADQGGGGVFNAGGIIDIFDTMVTNNVAAGAAAFSLSGDQENPAVITDAFGDALLIYDAEAQTLRVDIYVEGIELTDDTALPELSGAHIHIGDVGVNGAVEINFGTNGWVNDGAGIRLRLDDVAVPSANLDAILTGGAYVNIHSSDNGGGEIRGQIVFPSPMGSGGGIFNDQGEVTATNSVISSNVASRAGGGIENNDGVVALTNVSLDNNTAGPTGIASPGNGGGLHTSGPGSVTIIDSSVSGNISALEGGGLWNSATGTMTIERSTIAANTSIDGGGVFNLGDTGSTSITNSTIAANTATGLGGGIAIQDGTVNLTSVTIAANTAAIGGGIGVANGTVTSINSIIGTNTATTGPDISGSITSNGNNIVGDTTDATIVNSASSDLLDTDPVIGTLADNSGPTQTIELLAGSPAIDAGVLAGLDVDQRGQARPQGSEADIGAFEGTGTVSTDDAIFSIAATTADQDEGDTGVTAFTFTVTRSVNTVGASSVDFAVEGTGTSPADATDFENMELTTGTLDFADGETTMTITVNVVGDTATEADDTFNVVLSNPSVGSQVDTTATSALATIRNDDLASGPTLEIAAETSDQDEGDADATSFTFTVTRANSTTGTTTVDFAVVGSGTTPAAADDFTGGVLPTGTVTFADGETTQTITIDVAGDTTVELDETFTVTLSNPSTDAVVTIASADGSITNDDVPLGATLAIAATTADQDEGDATSTSFTFTVTRADSTTGTTTVDFAVTGSGTDPASEDDFVGAAFPTGTVTFADGETLQTITIDVAADVVEEMDETFTVTLSNPSTDAVITDATATGSIRNDDIAPSPTLTIAADSADQDEGDLSATSFSFIVTRSDYTTGTTTVDYAVTGTGTDPADAQDFFGGTLPTGTVTFADGEATQVILIDVAGDAVVEMDETFTIALSNPSAGATITTAIETGIIRNDDVAPSATLTIATDAADQDEGDAGDTSFTFTVTRADSTTGTTTVDYAISGSGTSPADADDFTGATLPSGTVTFADGETTQTITIDVAGDAIFEMDETFTVTLSNPSSDATITTATADAVILNDDAAPDATLAIAANNDSQLEGDAGATSFTFTVTRAVNVTGSTTVEYAVTSAGTNPVSDDDFAGGSLPIGTVTFADGETTQMITVNVAGDSTVETDEAFLITLLNPSTGSTIITPSASATILNDDVSEGSTIRIAAESADIDEGDSDSTSFTFTLTRGADTAEVTTVDYVVVGNGTSPATADDFLGGSFPSGTVTFAAGETTQTITIDVTGDTTIEPDEGFLVRLSNSSSNTTLITDAAFGTILNDDMVLVPSLAISADNASQDEGNSESTSFTFTVTRSVLTDGITTVDYTVSGDGSDPTDEADFAGNEFPSGTITFADGETTQSITIDIAGDTAIEMNERFAVTLSNPSGDAEIITASVSATILNDDDPPGATLSIASDADIQSEGNSGTTPFSFTVTRGSVTTGTTTVDYAVTGNGSDPASAEDFVGGVLPSGTVMFADGETTQTITINVAGDLELEVDESFVVTLSNASGDALITTDSAATIIGNDDINLAIATDNADQNEGNSGITDFTFTVTRSGSITGVTTVAYGVDLAGTDVVSSDDFADNAIPNGIVTFAAGESTKTITIGIVGDTTFEPDEEFVVRLNSPSDNASITTDTASAVVRNDDEAATVTLAIAADSDNQDEGNEGVTPFTFTVTRGLSTAGVTTVDYVVAGSGITPADADDFEGGVLPSGTITFAAGETTQTITVNVTGDTTIEPDETFTVTLTNPPSDTDLTTSEATSRIRNDDVDAGLTLAIAGDNADQDEGDVDSTAFTFIVTLSTPSTGTTTVDYAVTGSGSNPADSNDFADTILPSGTVTFADGETTQTITVNVTGDTSIEMDEVFTLTLSNPSSGTSISTATAEGTIRNDDVPPGATVAIAADDADNDEGDADTTAFTFVVTRGAQTTGTTSVDYTVSASGTNAASSDDFVDGVFATGTVTFADGETTQAISVEVLGDTVVENDETFTVTLSNPSGDTIIIAASADGIIRNDDVIVTPNPTLSVAASNAQQDEGDSGTTSFTFTVTRADATTGTTTVDYIVTGSGTSPANADDFLDAEFPSGTVTFADGETSQTITISVAGDTTIEADEGFTVTLSNPSSEATIVTDTATGLIVNDDEDVVALATLAITSLQADRAEGDAGQTDFTFTVTRSGNLNVAASAEVSVSGAGANPTDADDFGGTFPVTTVQFAAGETSQIVTITASGDNDVEADERFSVTLSNPSEGATITTAAAEGVIRDDDRPQRETRIMVPSLVARAHIIPGDSLPTAIIFQALTDTIVTVTPIDFATAGETIRILDGDVQPISEMINGIATATVNAGGLYAIVFEPQSTDRIYSVQSSNGYEALSHFPGTNILQPTDTTADGQTTARDALVIINSIARQSSGEGEQVASQASMFLDVNRDSNISALDALLVVNHLARQSTSVDSFSQFPVPEGEIASIGSVSQADPASVDALINSGDVGGVASFDNDDSLPSYPASTALAGDSTDVAINEMDFGADQEISDADVSLLSAVN